MRVLIVDDEPSAIRRMMDCLTAFPDVVIDGTCENGKVALNDIQRKRPDLIFLDVHIPVMGAFELLDVLEDEIRPLVVIVTAHDHFAVRAFEAHVIDYLLKPVNEKRLSQALARARTNLALHKLSGRTALLRNSLQQFVNGAESYVDETPARLPEESGRGQSHIWIRDRGKIRRVDPGHIEWIRAVRDYVCIFEHSRSYLVRESLMNLEKRLDPACFIRVHRSAIVNLNMVRELRFISNGHRLIMHSGEEIRIGRSYSGIISRHFRSQITT